MIDIESDVFDTVANALREEYPNLNIFSVFPVAPAKFPALTLIESDNRILQRMRTNNIENAVSVMYEANIYSNLAIGKKQEAKAIANSLDAVFNDMGFTRTFRQQIPNMKDATVYRIVCRYEAVIDKDLVIYHNE